MAFRCLGIFADSPEGSRSPREAMRAMMIAGISLCNMGVRTAERPTMSSELRDIKSIGNVYKTSYQDMLEMKDLGSDLSFLQSFRT